MVDIQWIPTDSSNYRKGRRDSIKVIVIHDEESPEIKDSAVNNARYFQGPNRGASAHYFVDDVTLVQGVREADCAWHAPGCNDDGIGIEHAGYASETRTQWTDDYSSKTLSLSAKLVAELCRKYSIPVRRLTVDQLRAGQKGIVGHIDVTNAYSGGKGHTDPGPNFPWDAYLKMVQAEYDALGGATWTKSKVAATAAACGLSVSVFAGVSVTNDPAPAPVVKPVVAASAPVVTPKVSPTPTATKAAAVVVVTPKASPTVAATPKASPTCIAVAVPAPAPKHAASTPAPKRVLRYGATGADVKAYETCLFSRGLLAKQWVDGYYGTTTVAATNRLIVRYRFLGTADGTAGPLTQKTACGS